MSPRLPASLRDDAYTLGRRQPQVAAAAIAAHQAKLDAAAARGQRGGLTKVWADRIAGWKAALEDLGRCFTCGELLGPDDPVNYHEACNVDAGPF